MFDMPDTIDYILKKTGAPDLTYIGFSQGTAQAFGGLSINPEMNEKVNLFIAMAPAASPKGFSHPLLDGFVKAAPSIIYCLLGRKIFLKSVVFWQRIISPPIFVKLIDGAVYFLFGWHCKNMSQDQKLVGYQHLFSMTSVKSIVHWFQIISSGRFQMYDETPSLLPWSTVNTVIDHLPPKFPTKQITTPIAIFYGSADTLVDFDILKSNLPPLSYVKNIHGWEHMDFLWAHGLERKVYPDILRLLEHFNSPPRIFQEEIEEKVPLEIKFIGISRDSRHKRSATGARRDQYRKKRKFELGRQSANTKLGGKRIHLVRVRGGNFKRRALRLESGNFSWGSEGISRKTRALTVVYNASNNELVRTNTLVKGAVIQIDATPFRQWYESHYAITLGKKSADAAVRNYR
ncbi:hypothetical protein G6F42_019173 [Rhizopus arrhizus]|nr:hypothetical protein G6F42_019173 [Rhizopus arrhizus]